MRKLKEIYLALKQKYIELAKAEFTFEAQSQYTDKFKRFSKLNGWIKTGATDEANRILCTVINDNATFLLGKVKALAQTKLTEFKATYESAYQDFKTAVANNEVPPETVQKLFAEFRELQKSIAPIQAMTSFEVTSEMNGIKTTEGKFAGLLAEVLTNDIDLLVTKFKQACVAEFAVKVDELDQEVVDYQAAKG